MAINDFLFAEQMIRVVEADSTDKSDWNRLLVQKKESFVFQSISWGRFVSEYIGSAVTNWLAMDEEDNCVGLMLTVRECRARDKFFERPLQKITMPILRRFAGEVLVLGGPIVLQDSLARDVVTAFANHVTNLVKESGPLAVAKVILPKLSGELESAYGLAFRKFGFAEDIAHTMIIDLTVGEERLYSSLAASARKALRKAKDDVVVSKISSVDELVPVYEMCKSVRANANLRTFSFENWSRMWEKLGPENAIHMFVARSGEEMLSCLGLWAFNQTLHEFASVQTPRARGLFCGDLLKWEVMRWGVRNGYVEYDLAGVNCSPDAPEKERKIYQFKRKWGGRLVGKRVYRVGRFGAARSCPR